MNTWLIPRTELTPDQMRAVEMKPDQNRVVFGIAGSGKTQVLVHRADYLAHSFRVSPERYRVFVFTNVIKHYITTGIQLLGMPDETVSTFDHWCRLFYEREISRNLPWKDRAVDFEKIRQGVLECLMRRPRLQKCLDFALVDEGQDLPQIAYDILLLAAKHITVFADWMQQIFEEGASEDQLLATIGVGKENVTLLGAYRNSPYVAELASYFLSDPLKRRQYLSHIGVRQMIRERPLCFVAQTHEQEMDQLAKVIQQRLLHDERVGIIVPKNRYVYGFAQALSQRGVPVEKAVPHRKSASTIEYDFGNSTPKIATFHSAKGLTFDSVLLPRLTAEAFSSVHTEALRMRMLFVGIARAMQWVYLSTQRDQEMTEWRLLQDAIANRHLTILQASTVPPRQEDCMRETDDMDLPF